MKTKQKKNSWRLNTINSKLYQYDDDWEWLNQTSTKWSNSYNGRIEKGIQCSTNYSLIGDPSLGAMTRTCGNGVVDWTKEFEFSRSKFNREAPFAGQYDSTLAWHCLCVNIPHSI